MKTVILTIATIFAIATSAQAKWESFGNVDEMTGVKNEFSKAYSTDSSGNIVIRTKEENSKSFTEMYWTTGDQYICSTGDYLTVQVKIDDGKVFEESVLISTDSQALFFNITKILEPEIQRTFDIDEYLRLLELDMREGSTLALEYHKTNKDVVSKFVTFVSNGLVENLKGAKQIFLRVHDDCGTQTTQKFVF